MENGYATLRDVNKSQRDNVESKKSTIFKSIAIGATVVGGIGTVILGGPLGLGLFAAFAEAGPAVLGGLAAGGVAGGGLGGLGIGAATKKWFPRKWFGEQSALKKTMKRLKQSLKDGFSGEVETFNNSTLPVVSSATSTHDNVVSSPSNVETASVNTTVTKNEEPEHSSNTVTLSDHSALTQNNTASISSNITTDGTVEASDPTTPTTDNAETADLGRTDYLYLPQLAANAIRNFISNFLHR